MSTLSSKSDDGFFQHLFRYNQNNLNAWLVSSNTNTQMQIAATPFFKRDLFEIVTGSVLNAPLFSEIKHREQRTVSVQMILSLQRSYWANHFLLRVRATKITQCQSHGTYSTQTSFNLKIVSPDVKRRVERFFSLYLRGNQHLTRHTWLVQYLMHIICILFGLFSVDSAYRDIALSGQTGTANRAKYHQ